MRWGEVAIDRAVDLLGQMRERHEMGRGGYRQSSRPIRTDDGKT